MLDGEDGDSKGTVLAAGEARASGGNYYEHCNVRIAGSFEWVGVLALYGVLLAASALEKLAALKERGKGA